MGKHMNSSQKNKRRSIDISARLQEARKDKDWGEVADILDRASKDDIKALAPMIPDLIEHPRWLVRASVVEAISYANLRLFAGLVKDRLKDSNRVVRSYALRAYYDLLGSEALRVIDAFCGAKDVRVRVTALALRYVETGDHGAFDRLRRILTRKGCDFRHRSTVMWIFEDYCADGPNSDVIRLHEEVLKDLPKSLGVAKDMGRMLKKWRAT
jgi:hypothetical protein